MGANAGLGWVALKALLLYLTAIAGFRLGERRTLAEMAPFDFVAAVAAGAIVGRVPNSSGTGYWAGAITLVTIIAAHRIISRLRYVSGLEPLFSHPPCFLVSNGRVDEKILRKSGLTRTDLHALLRQHGVYSMDEVKHVIFEHRGKLSIIKKGGEGSEGELVTEVVEMTKE